MVTVRTSEKETAGVSHGVMGNAKRKLEEAALCKMADFEARQTANTLHVIAKTRYGPMNTRSTDRPRSKG